MQSNSRSGVQCAEHPSQEITNFCLHFDCLKPLCPDCVELHTKSHQKQQIESWKHCVNKSIKHLNSTLQHLRRIYQHLNQYRSFKTVQTIESQNVKRLYQIKARIQQTLDEIFNQHQRQLRTLIRNQYRVDQPDTAKLKTAIQEIQRIIMKMGHSQTVIPALKKSLVLDYQSLINHFDDLKARGNAITVNETFVSDNSDYYINLKSMYQQIVRFNSDPVGHTHHEPINIYHSPRKVQPSPPDSSHRLNNIHSLPIHSVNYFQADCPRKYLHFFIPASKQLKLLSIQHAEDSKWKSIHFRSKQQLPCYFKSVITPHGDIYLTGGSEDSVRCNQIWKYNFESNSLDFVAKMNNARSSHSIAYVNGVIYIIGGFTRTEGEITRECEAFNTVTNVCERIASLNMPSANSCATPFFNDIIMKFGGVLNRFQGNSLIEMYQIRNNRWHIVQMDIAKNIPKLQLLSFSAAVQINQNDIMVFGGYDNSQLERPQRISYIASVNVSQHSVSIKNYNSHPLKHAQGFWNNNPLVYHRRVYALQNITDEYDELTAIADERRVIIFDGERWV